MREYLKQIGQGMSEYLIILAMIVIAGVAVYAIYNDKGRGEAVEILPDTGQSQTDTGPVNEATTSEP